MKTLLLVLALMLALPAHAEETLVLLVVDGKPMGGEPRMLDPEQLAFSLDEWTALGVNVPKPLRTKASLSAEALGVGVEYVSEKAELRITIPAALRPRQKLGWVRELPSKVDPAPKGVMLDYDVAATVQGSHRAVSVGHVARAGIAGGVLTTTGQANWVDGNSDYIRGRTTWQRDNLASGTTLQLGDVGLPNNGLNNPALLGGVRIGSDRFLKRQGAGYDIPLIGGLADTRSTAEVFINEHQRATGQVAPGPYELAPTIAVPGLNNLEVVQRDQFGREQTFSRSFYTHPDLLRKGTTEWDIAAGAVRTDPIGNHYEGLAVQGTIHRGLTDRWTAGVTVQSGKVGDQGGRNATLHNTVSLGHGGLLQADVSTSQRDDGAKGSALRVGYERRSQNWSISASHMRKSDDYWEISDFQGSPFKIHEQTTAALSFRPQGQPWQASLSYSDIHYNDQRLQRVSAMASLNQARATWMVGVSHDLGTGDNQAFVGVRLKNSRLGQTSFVARAAPNVGPRLDATYSGATDIAGRSLRYQVGASLGDTNNAYGSVNTSVAGGDLTLEARKFGDEPVLVNGRYRNSVWIGEGGIINGRGNLPGSSFALVEVPGQAGIDVGGGGTRQTPTNRRGYALLPGLPGLSPTNVAIDATQLPVDVSMEGSHAVVVAPRQGGAKVVFPVEHQTVQQWEVRVGDDYAPENARVVSDQGETFRLGARGVLVFEKPARTARMELDGKFCELALPAEGGRVLCTLDEPH